MTPLRRRPVWALLAAFSVAGIPTGIVQFASAQTPPPQEVAQWLIGGADSPVRPSASYGLYNMAVDRWLRYRVRAYGPNLDWATEAREEFSFHRPDGSDEPVRYGERVAVFVGDHGYLNYKIRSWGPNLEYFPTPVHQWILGGGEKDSTVRAGEIVSLYNLRENDFLVYCKRAKSINLRWLKDKVEIGCAEGWKGRYLVWKKKAKEIMKDAKDLKP